MKHKGLLAVIGSVIFLPLLQLFFFYLVAMSTGLPGRRGGPQDAFRHTYASAVVSKYVSLKIVKVVTNLIEVDSASPYDAMDIHNNMIGIEIGLSSRNIYRDVVRAVSKGVVGSKKSNQIKWLPEDMWSNGF